MWLLIATLCLEVAPGEVECSREARGPFVEETACRERVRITGDTALLVAATIGVKVIYLTVGCEVGRDG